MRCGPVQTEDLELKKLVYLYLINYAKTQPDLAIMGVNTFVKVRSLVQQRACLFHCLQGCPVWHRRAIIQRYL